MMLLETNALRKHVIQSTRYLIPLTLSTLVILKPELIAGCCYLANTAKAYNTSAMIIQFLLHFWPSNVDFGFRPKFTEITQEPLPSTV